MRAVRAPSLAARSSRCPPDGFESRSTGTAPGERQTPALSFLAALAAGPPVPGEVALPAPAFLPAPENASVGRRASAEGVFLRDHRAAASAGGG